MTVALVVGAGEVGTRAARQLVDTAGFASILLPDRDRARAGALAGGLAPGLTDVLAIHAAALFEHIDEVRVARTGWAGPASVETVRHERRLPVRAWRDGGWREERSPGDALVFFPDPIGGRDCRIVTGSTRLLVDAFP